MKQKSTYILLILAAIFIFAAGCTAGGGGGVNNAINFKQQELNLQEGWNQVFSQPDKAIQIFEQTLVREDLLDDVEYDIYCGLGWAYANKKSYDKAIEYFLPGQKRFNDSALGLAASYVAKNTADDYKKALIVLKGMGLEKTGKEFVSEHSLPYTTSDAHAIMAVVYYFTGNTADAANHIKYAYENNSPESRYVNAIYKALIEDMNVEDSPYFCREIF